MHATALRCTAILGALLPWGAEAHRPIETPTAPSTPATAVHIDRPDVSQVLYQRLDLRHPRVWLRFEGRAGQQIHFSLGVPALGRLRDFRPRVALVGPGLPDAPLGFARPDGTGARVFAGGAPRDFHEPFTGTDSWILVDETVTLPASGTWYLVGYSVPAPRPGDKLWLSIGEAEDFGLADLSRFGRWRREIRRFHEVKPPPFFIW